MRNNYYKLLCSKNVRQWYEVSGITMILVVVVATSNPIGIKVKFGN